VSAADYRHEAAYKPTPSPGSCTSNVARDKRDRRDARARRMFKVFGTSNHKLQIAPFSHLSRGTPHGR